MTRTRGTLTSACGALLALALASFGCTMAVDLGGDGGESASLVPFAGPRSSCILSDSGRLQCFGAGGAGQLSLEPASLHALCDGEPCEFFPSTFALRNASSVALGDAFTCVVLEGAVWCAGSNAFGALARGTRDPDPHVQPLESDVSGVIVELAAGREHVCARRDDGTVACWGLGNHGALGVDPATLTDCGLVDAAQEARLGLTAGETRRCALDAVEVPGITDARGLRTGPFGTCVLRAGGAPLCFGRNVGGSLGVGMSTGEVVSTPTALLVTNATDVALGTRHGCALDTLGRTHCFGLHDVGQLGVGNAAPDTCAGQPCAWAPLRVTDLAGASRVVAGDEHTCVLLDDSQLRCFGNDTVGQVGNSSGALDDCSGTPCARTPRDVVEGDAVAQVVASGNHTVLVTTDGTPMAFGSNVFRECSNATADVIPWPGTVYSISP